ncbi:hypothetical protein NX059_012259 [Plenodomus lindquistii]|nr:hypothetical protein NX059_012259 [Plenodomus lindquistii]
MAFVVAALDFAISCWSKDMVKSSATADFARLVGPFTSAQSFWLKKGMVWRANKWLVIKGLMEDYLTTRPGGVAVDEIESDGEPDGTEADKLARLPPEQRAAVEKMMAEQKEAEATLMGSYWQGELPEADPHLRSSPPIFSDNLDPALGELSLPME